MRGVEPSQIVQVDKEADVAVGDQIFDLLLIRSLIIVVVEKVDVMTLDGVGFVRRIHRGEEGGIVASLVVRLMEAFVSTAISNWHKWSYPNVLVTRLTLILA